MRVDFQAITSLLSDKIMINLNLAVNEEIKTLFNTMSIRFKRNVDEVKNLEIKEEQILEI
jgi:hypothetical protein